MKHAAESCVKVCYEVAMLQDAYEQCLDDGYEYSQAVYDDEDDQPVTRRSGYNQYANDPERRISQISQHTNQGSTPQVCSYWCATCYSSVGGLE